MITVKSEGMKVEIADDKRLENIIGIQLVPEGILHSMTIKKAENLVKIIQNAIKTYNETPLETWYRNIVCPKCKSNNLDIHAHCHIGDNKKELTIQCQHCRNAFELIEPAL